jgi:hypothetical protein
MTITQEKVAFSCKNIEKVVDCVTKDHVHICIRGKKGMEIRCLCVV